MSVIARHAWRDSISEHRNVVALDWKCRGISKNNGGHRKPRVSPEGSAIGIRKVCGVVSFISALVPPPTVGWLPLSSPSLRLRINFPASRRNASRLLYRISLQLTPLAPPPVLAAAVEGCGSRSRSVLHISFVPGALREAERVPVSFFRNCKGSDPWPGNWNSPLRTRVTSPSSSVGRRQARRGAI